MCSLHDQSSRPGPTTKQDKGENDVVRMTVLGLCCIALVLFGPFQTRAMVSITWHQRGVKTMAGCTHHRSLHLVLVSSSQDGLFACQRHYVGGRQGWQSDHLTDESSVVVAIQMVGTATSVDRPTTEMVVRTLGRCVGIFVVHPDGPIFLRAGRRPYQRSLPTRHTFPPPQTHFTSQTYA